MRRRGGSGPRLPPLLSSAGAERWGGEGRILLWTYICDICTRILVSVADFLSVESRSAGLTTHFLRP